MFVHVCFSALFCILTPISNATIFSQRLQVKILKLVDVSYGGENGFNQVCIGVLSN